MAWSAVRDALAQALATVAITDPSTLTIAAVFSHPEDSISTFPCFVIIPPDHIEIERLSGVRTETARVRCRFMCLDGGNEAMATKVAAAFREATIAVFDSQVTVKGTGSPTGMLLGDSEGPIQPSVYAGQRVVIFESEYTIQHDTITDIS